MNTKLILRKKDYFVLIPFHKLSPSPLTPTYPPTPDAIFIYYTTSTIFIVCTLTYWRRRRREGRITENKTETKTQQDKQRTQHAKNNRNRVLKIRSLVLNSKKILGEFQRNKKNLIFFIKKINLIINFICFLKGK
jgi:flagellar biosynthesis component FlhA